MPRKTKQLPLQGARREKKVTHLVDEPIVHPPGKMFDWLDAFIVGRRANNVTQGTLRFYKYKFQQWVKFCVEKNILEVEDITPAHIREYLIWLEERGSVPGGIHAGYRTLRSFLLWYEEEVDPPYWRNPIKKVKAPINKSEPLDPVELDVVAKMIAACDTQSVVGLRDRAVMLFLLDTGVRAVELVSIERSCVDLITGSVKVLYGKGRKSRDVFMGAKCRKALRNYLQQRTDDDRALWMSREGEPLTYWGLAQILERRSADIGVAKVTPHDFRRAFALNCIRNGMDIYSLKDIMGQADLQVLQRYLKLTGTDLRNAHAKASPVDRANFK